MTEKKQIANDHIYDLIKTNSLFSGFTAEQLSLICDLFHKKSVNKGDLVMQQGSRAKSLYIIVTGRVLVFRETEEGESIPIDTSGPGECLGEMAYFTDKRRSAFVRAMEDCFFLQLDYKDIDMALQKIPSLSMNLTNMLQDHIFPSLFWFLQHLFLQNFQQ
ncbi:MAG: cyclic nucleotide-binding domain-containing protein [Thermodesulfobacteriota bacterium]|nr:cyclic nucleotide-binding domain-containing protein [Thermodesulfobacteriota bacterium]